MNSWAIAAILTLSIAIVMGVITLWVALILWLEERYNIPGWVVALGHAPIVFLVIVALLEFVEHVS